MVKFSNKNPIFCKTNDNLNDIVNVMIKKKIWDLIIIGGGSSGLGIAVDSASRGYKTLLIEKYDFSILYSEESKGFSPFKDEDPFLCRIIAKKI